MEIRSGLAAASVALALFSASAAAQQLYIGASGGGTRVDSGDFAGQVDAAHPWMEALEASDAKASASGAAGRIFAGVRITNHFALEVDYTHLGKIRSSYTQSDLDPMLSRGFLENRIESQADALGLALVARAPIAERVEVFGRVGVARTRLDQAANYQLYRSNTAGEAPRLVASFTNSNAVVNETRPVAGLGLDWRVTPRVALRGSWDRYFGVGRTYDAEPGPNKQNFGEYDIDYFAIGVTYAF